MGNTNQSIVIDAGIDDVWARISDFHNMDWASAIMTSCEAAGDKGTSDVGAMRVLNGAIHETLTELDAGQYRMSYSIDQGPSPISPDEVSNYVGTIVLKPAGAGQTMVEWTSSWTGNDGPAEEFCRPIYAALLDALKASFTSASAG